MKNYINKNINNSIKWNKNKEGKIRGLNIFDKSQIIGRKSKKSWSDTKEFPNPTGYCGSIELTTFGDHLQIWTNGNYQFIKKEIAIKLFSNLLKELNLKRVFKKSEKINK
jgi:hypothetical protein